MVAEAGNSVGRGQSFTSWVSNLFHRYGDKPTIPGLYGEIEYVTSAVSSQPILLNSQVTSSSGFSGYRTATSPGSYLAKSFKC